jgi:hypothetical protein
MDYTDKDNHTDHTDCECLAFVCMLVANTEPGVDSDIKQCDACGEDVWSSKGQRAAARAEFPDVNMLFRCLPCFLLTHDGREADLSLSIKWAKQGGAL